MNNHDDLIIKNCTITEYLAGGSYGKVYSGWHLTKNQMVAIKILEGKISKKDREYFKREADALRELDHPFIVKYIEEDLSANPPYIVMDRVNGKTMEEHIKKNDIPLLIKLNILQCLAEAIDAAHTKEILHRDIKPSNIMLEPNKDKSLEPRLLDFGISKKIGSTITTPARTPRYSSPEQTRNEHLDSYSDIFSFGMIAFEFLTSKYAFGTDSEHERLERDPVLEPLAVLKGNKQNLHLCFSKVLSKTKTERHNSCMEFIRNMEACLNNILDLTKMFPSESEPNVNKVRKDIFERLGGIKETINIFINHSRILLDAQYKTASNECKSKGILKNILEAELQNNGMEKESFERYIKIWSTLDSVHKIKNSRDSYFLTKNDKLYNSRPSVYMLVTWAFSSSVPEYQVLDHYRANIVNKYHFSSSEGFVLFVHRFAEHFNSLRKSTYNKCELFSDFDTEVTPNTTWYDGIIEVFEFLAILKVDMADHAKYKITFKADPGFILTNIFGRCTGIKGLDYLFYGGLWVPSFSNEKESQCIVITGSPGMGKTTLALSLGVQVAARGGLFLYFCSEEDRNGIKRKINSHHRLESEFFDIEMEMCNEINSPFKGRVIIRNLSEITYPFGGDFVDKTVENISTLTQHGYDRCGEKTIVFDSLSSIHGFNVDDRWRKETNRLTSELKELGFLVVFLIEATPRNPSFMEYMSDICLSLDETKNPSDYIDRTISIIKTRMQPFHRGKHVYSIHSGSGFKVFPSSMAVMGARRWHRARTKFGNKAIHSGIKGFDKYLSQNSDDTISTWWREGSISLLTGQRGNLKTPFAEAFAMATMLEDDRYSFNISSSLFIHFGPSYYSNQFKFEKKDQHYSYPAERYDIPFPGRNNDSGVVYIGFNGGHISPGQVLQVIIDIIREKRRNQIRFLRAVVSDLGNISPDFPSLKRDQVFIPALCNLLESEGITTVLVYSTPEQNGEDYIADQVKSVSENIIKFEPFVFGGKEYNTVSVIRSSNSTQDHGVFELKFKDERKFKKGFLEILPSFDLVLGALSDKPTSAKVNILYRASTEIQKNYHSEIASFHNELGTYNVRLLNAGLSLTPHWVKRHIMTTGQALWIVQVDSKSLNICNNYSESSSVFHDLSYYIEACNLKENLIQMKMPKRKEIYSVPYYLNPSFLVLRGDFNEFIRRDDILGHQKMEDGDYSWDDLLEHARNYCSSHHSGHIPIDVPFGIDEDLNCFFFEILASLNPDLIKNSFRDLFTKSTNRNSAEFKNLLDAAFTLFEIVNDKYKWPNKDKKDNIIKTSRFACAKNAVISRHWYTTFRQFQSSLSEIDPDTSKDYIISYLPQKIWTCGDWHFSILNGSVAPREGFNIIHKEFLDKTKSIHRMIHGVGLPPYRDFYKNQAILATSQVKPSWFKPYIDGENVIYRTMIDEYAAISHVIFSHLQLILAIVPNRDTEKRRNEIYKLISTMVSLIQEIINSKTKNSIFRKNRKTQAFKSEKT